MMTIRTLAGIGICISVGVIIGMLLAWIDHLYKDDENQGDFNK